MEQTYEDACLETISRERAHRTILEHNLDWNDFLDEVGDKEFYSGQEILDWLGY